ncbi:MAG: hypothetical protein ACLP8S_21530 [Solirubrobacteraceae bacterium]
MAKPSGKVHLAVTRRVYKDTEYKATLLRRSYRQDGKVRNETVGNLSHLEQWIIDGLRAMLAGRRLVDLDEGFEIVRSLPHGNVEAVLGALRVLDLERLISGTRCRERDLVVAMIVQQVLAPGSRLTHARRFSQTTLSEELELGEVSEAELLSAIAWLLERQQRIEKTLATRHLGTQAFVRYDVRANYGAHGAPASPGILRELATGGPRTVYGLTCTPDGRPLAIGVHAGSGRDQRALPNAVQAVSQRCGIQQVIVIAQRGVILAELLSQKGIEFVTELRVGQILALVRSGDLELSLVGDTEPAEITSELYPAERLIAYRSPAFAAQCARERETTLSATGDGDQIQAETELDGVYVIRTSSRPPTLTNSATVRAYQQLELSEPAFSKISDGRQSAPTELRPEASVHAHAFLCMLAYYLTWHLKEVWTPLIFGTPDGTNADIRTGAQFSGYLSVLSELATQTRCTMRMQGTAATFDKLTTPTKLQVHALALAASEPAIA